MKRGYGSPIVRIFNETEDLIVEGVSRFKYSHSEKADDASFITIETDNTDIVDHPDFQEKKKIKVLWGYSGDNIFQKRTLYIWDIKTSFEEIGIRLEIEAYCKAAYLKLNSSKDIFSDSTLEDVAENMAEAYGLNLKKENIDPQNEEQPSDYYELSIGGKTTSKMDLEDRGRINSARDNTANVQKYVFKRYGGGIPQANRSDQKLLDDLTRIEPVDNLVLDGRDDDLIIRRRNFLQRPYKAYTFKAEPGYLLSFNPGTKNNIIKKNAISSSVSGWLEEDKTFVQGQVDRSQSGAGILGDLVEVSLESIIRSNTVQSMRNPLDRPLTVDGLSQQQQVGIDDNGNPIIREVFTQKLDSTKQAFIHFHKRGVQPSKLVVDSKTPFYSSAIDVTGRIETRGVVTIDPKEYIPTVETNVQDIAGAGINRQSQGELQLTESNAKVVGDPTLVSAKIITIAGVGKRWSGNYYIASVEHEIVKDGGYLCYLTLYRMGSNKLSPDDKTKVTAETLGIIKNTLVANPTDGTTQLVNVPVTPD